MNRLPQWLKQEIPDDRAQAFSSRLAALGVHTVCVEARCPNTGRCFRQNAATFMILGTVCTRTCSFCNVRTSARLPLPLDEDEPRRIAAAIEALGITGAVITSVTRDDLPDGGAAHFARTIKAIRALGGIRSVEVLIPDFQGRTQSLRTVAEAGPDVIGHNIETVKRLYPFIRPQADYRRSLEVLKTLKTLAPDILSKSSLMLGLSETEAEVLEAMRDMRASGCDILMMGQYLAPSAQHTSVREFIEPQRFDRYKGFAQELGFKSVAAGPFVRSSLGGRSPRYHTIEM